jgi:hypothetical protein
MKTKKNEFQLDSVVSEDSSNVNVQTNNSEKKEKQAISERKIWPIIIYPFNHPVNTNHLEKMMDMIIHECENKKMYENPTVVLNKQTRYRVESKLGKTEKEKKEKESFNTLINKYKNLNIEFIDVWSVDTCQMWLDGFGYSMDNCHKKHRTNDVFWLIPGDFYYNLPGGDEALANMLSIPKTVYNSSRCKLCLGEIKTPNNSAKQLIDTYGTYGLLYNWFPTEAQGLRDITSKPRTEFFAIAQEFLEKALVNERWYGYEQTIHILLQNMKDDKPVREVRTVELGGIEDDPGSRSSLASAMQQIERTERVLKLIWREINERKISNWQEKFRQLDKQSEEVRGAAMTIIAKLLPS